MNILEKIVAQKRVEVAKLAKRPVSAENARWIAQAYGPRRPFLSELRSPRFGSPALIAEVKKASPSAGLICADFNPAEIASTYERAGAACISVLTDETFFQGSLDYLREIRQAVKTPLLRKDFIIDELQILESLEAGADAILLIVSILSDAQLKAFHALATTAGLAVLVEVHNEAELERALTAGATLLGINNRDLKTFKVDLATTERLAQKARAIAVDASFLMVAESGIHTRADVERVTKAGASAILVGESLVKEKNIGAKVGELIGLEPALASTS